MRHGLENKSTQQLIARLIELQGKYGISPSGEGGEIETTVLDAPHVPRIKSKSLITAQKLKGTRGFYNIRQARLVPK